MDKKNTKAEVSVYLNYCRSNIGEQQQAPPVANEIKELIIYLNEEGVNPIVVGSVALVYHLQLTAKELKNGGFRPTVDVDIFVSKLPQKPPHDWHRDLQSIGVTSWISPLGGYVDFLEAGHEFPDTQKILIKVEKDPGSEKVGYPIANLQSLFRLKLNSNREKDLFDLLLLAERVGIPQDLEEQLLNETQNDNLDFVKRWIANKRE